MAKIDKEAAQAFLNQPPFNGYYKKGNTYVNGNFNSGFTMWLHDNVIAYTDFVPRPNKIMLTLAGYNTRTTRNRLNAILELAGSKSRIVQRKGESYILYIYNLGTGYYINFNPSSWYVYDIEHKTFEEIN